MKILIIGALPRSLINFRGPLMQAMIASGHSVAACANGHDHITEQKLEKMGITYFPVHLARAEMNPINDIITIFDIIRIISQFKPDILLSYTIKPVI